MNESRNFRIALLSGRATQWGEEITPLLLAQSDSLVVLETAEELLSMQQAARPEMIFICHQPGVHDGFAEAEQVRSVFAVTPLVLLAAENIETLEAAVKVGALAVLEPPFSEAAFTRAFNSCCHLAQSLRWEELKQQQNRCMSELFKQSPCCHLFVDTSGAVTFLNDEAMQVMRIAEHSALEFSQISRRFFAPHGANSPAEMETAVQSQNTWQGALSGRAADGSFRVYQVICAPATQPDTTHGTLITLHDITDQQSKLAQLRISLQAARDCLTLATAPETNAELLRLSNPDYRSPLMQETFSLPALLESVKDAGETAAAPPTIIIPEYIPEYFRGDAKRLGYALKAVILGSTGFGKGWLRISVSLKERTPAGMTIQLTVYAENTAITSDCYQGAADYLDSDGDMQHAATGLGLAAELIGQMNGTLLIRTERGRGRTVFCAVPLFPEAAEAVSAAAKTFGPAGSLVLDSPAPEQFSALKVLVAEDSLMEQTKLKHLLESIDCQTIIVGNGREAVDEFENGEFDVVLMDILMPEMDGFEATRLIRERERIIGGSIPVIALTSYSLKAIQDKCASVGMNGYLAKPVAKAKLMEVLQGLGKQQKRDASVSSAGIIQDFNELPVLDAPSILEIIGFDLNLYRELVEMYLANCTAQGNELVMKLAGGDIKDLLACAHSAKGIVSSIGGIRLAEIANRIQNMCREDEKPDRTVWGPLVEVQSAALKTALENIDWHELERFVAGK